ncbi:type II secretion system protein [Pigmentiphaga sp. H8]|uniref:type II secretion system protein n=1 Tax=Pigmentiphaga sp. H8 TaxID=2488560 RepID=UPI000F5A0364|nr:type II secretion system protein [Pigmentiphaga sp. H8]AZG07701.1 type II secretion system protein [Pigmentiphaga sp. H8]
MAHMPVRAHPPAVIAARQRGWTLIELAIVASIAMVLVVLAGGRLIREVDDAAAQATGTYLLAIKGAMDGYLVRHYDTLAEGGSVAGVVSALAPTLDELRSAGLLQGGFPERTPFNQSVAIRIERSAACPENGCRVDALIHTSTPLRPPGTPEPDPGVLAQVVMASGGYGAAAYPDQPAVMRGATYAVPNPLGATAGVVGAVASLDTTMFQQFVRMRDSRNPDLQGGLDVKGVVRLHDSLALRGPAGDCLTATNTGVLTVQCAGVLQARTGLFRADNGSVVRIDPASGIVASQRIHAAAGLSTDRGSIFDAADAQPTLRVAAGQMIVATGAGLALSVVGRDLVGHAGVSVDRLGVREVAAANTACTARISSQAGANAEFARTSAGGLLVCADGTWRELAALASTGGACNPNGAFATDSGSGTGLVCRLGVWMRADDLLSSYVMTGSQIVASGDSVLKPACGRLGTAAGTPLIYLLPQIESSKASSFTRKAVDAGAGWQVQLLDHDGTILGGPARAIAQVYCKY